MIGCFTSVTVSLISMTTLILASSGDVLFDVLGWVFVVAMAVIALYIFVGVMLLPVWGAGVVLQADRVAAWGRGWWSLPRLALERGEQLFQDLIRPREGSTIESPRDPKPDPRDAQPSDWATSLGQLVVWVLAILGGLTLIMTAQDSVIQPLVGGRVGAAVAAAALLLTAASAGTAWVLSRRYPYRHRPPVFRFFIATTVVVGFVTYAVIFELQSSGRLVSDYCAYGSVSQAQLDGCKRHVTANDVRSRDTPAAHFAQSGSSEDVCGAGSGPFCEQALNRRYVEDQAPPPGQ
jgi:hypothetical protein